MRDKNKKSWPKIVKEFLALWVSSKELPLNYISHLLYRQDIENYKDYLSLKENRKLLQWSHSLAKEQIVLVENKLLFENFLVKNDVPTPRIFFHNLKNRFTYRDDTFEIRTKKDFLSFLETVLKEEKVERIFCKPIDGIMGEHIFIMEGGRPETLSDDVMDLVLSKGFIFQECIAQHETLDQINSSSVNTLRVITHKNGKNEVEVLSSFIRVGRKGAIIDNAHFGGIVVPLDKDSGKMGPAGIQLIDNGGGLFYKHPDTEIFFDGFQIPHYNQTKKIAAQAASLFEFPLLGWDVAIAPEGPVIIEANHDFHLLLSDRTEKGLKRNPSFKKLIERAL